MSDCRICGIWEVEAEGDRCTACERYYQKNNKERSQTLIDRERARTYHSGEGALWARIGAKITRSAEDDCWSWIGSKNGQVSVAGKPYYVHRLIYQASNDRTLTAGVKLKRTCHMSSCVFPNHMEEVS